ncbi:transposable element Tc1 transposase [Trichonephila clavipes]|nr:transposable element Tc1 transposase [Trichonephila clavipes]
MDQTFSIGERSGERADQGNSRAFSVSRKVRTILETCGILMKRRVSQGSNKGSAVIAPDSSLSTIRRATRTRVSDMTIHRRLIERNLPSCGPLRHLPLTPTHFRGILQWCLALSGWNQPDWGSIAFRDESRFQLRPDDHRRRVWRRPGQRANPALTIARRTGPYPGVMVRGAISFDSRAALVIIRGTLTEQRYVDDILRTVMLLFLLQYPGLIFQQDNARSDTARVAMNCLIASQTLSWPFRSSDLSSIQHV